MWVTRVNVPHKYVRGTILLGLAGRPGGARLILWPGANRGSGKHSKLSDPWKSGVHLFRWLKDDHFAVSYVN